MSISTLGTLFQFIGGLGMFLYGMESMADGLQKFAGNRLQRVLEILTFEPLAGRAGGAGVTAIIQSSSATTVMVVGFVNAGIINLLQATGIIMGANIGTTVTSWIVSMSEWGEVLKPEVLCTGSLRYRRIHHDVCEEPQEKRGCRSPDRFCTPVYRSFFHVRFD